jgi:SAM-dependent methyltransferase
MNADEAGRLIHGIFSAPGFRRATFAGTQRGPAKLPWQRVTIRPLELQGEITRQFVYFDGRKTETHHDQPERRLRELTAAQFAGVHLTTADEEIDIRTTKKGAVTVGRKKAAHSSPLDLAHNRSKDVPLPEGAADQLLSVLGIMTADGRVKPTMRAKYTQINEFLRHLAIALDDAKLTGPVSILDCGCGSSYLTLAAHHYLNHVRRQPATLIGVDVNEALIRASAAKAEHLAADAVQFVAGSITALETKPDVVLALHACDTATDDALRVGIESGAKAILAVPCCHRAVNRQLTSTQPAELTPILRHGLLRERLADLATDAFRAQALRVAGYRAEVVEFVAPDVSPKNLLIRAVYTGRRDPADAEALAAMAEFLGVKPTRVDRFT